MSTDPRRTCPNRANHTPAPDGYIAWHEWAEKMARTHRQIPCPGCGRLSIWIERLRALSVRQPWAAAIAHYGKTVENRTRATAHRGLVVIHASLELADNADAALDFIAHITGRDLPEIFARTRVRGAVIAAVNIAGCHQHTCPRHPCDHHDAPICEPWAARGQWHWELAGARPLPHPIPARGALGLWRLDDHTDAAVRAALELEVAHDPR